MVKFFPVLLLVFAACSASLAHSELHSTAAFLPVSVPAVRVLKGSGGHGGGGGGGHGGNNGGAGPNDGGGAGTGGTGGINHGNSYRSYGSRSGSGSTDNNVGPSKIVSAASVTRPTAASFAATALVLLIVNAL